MTANFAPPQYKQAKTPLNIAYENLQKLCPSLNDLKEGEFVTLHAKNKAMADVVIGNKGGVYEIVSEHRGVKVFTTVDVCRKSRTAEALIFESSEAGGTKKITLAEDTAPTRLNDLLSHIGRYYEPQRGINQVSLPSM